MLAGGPMEKKADRIQEKREGITTIYLVGERHAFRECQLFKLTKEKINRINRGGQMAFCSKFRFLFFL